MPEPIGAPSRGEFDMLARQVGQLGVQLAGLDASGTRGTVAALGVVQVQITDLKSDVAELRARVDLHEQQHQVARDQAERDRISRDRYRLSSAIAGVSAFGAIFGALLYVAAHLHLAGVTWGNRTAPPGGACSRVGTSSNSGADPLQLRAHAIGHLPATVGDHYNAIATIPGPTDKPTGLGRWVIKTCAKPGAAVSGCAVGPPEAAGVGGNPPPNYPPAPLHGG